MDLDVNTKFNLQIAWILRTTKAFRQLFPPDREEECAKELGYARYQDGRLIAQQDQEPEWFYYILAGKGQISE